MNLFITPRTRSKLPCQVEQGGARLSLPISPKIEQTCFCHENTVPLAEMQAKGGGNLMRNHYLPVINTVVLPPRDEFTVILDVGALPKVPRLPFTN